MRRLLIPAVLLGLAAPAMASATVLSATGTVTVDGSVAARCQFTTGTATITLGELAKPDGTFDPTTVDGQNRTLTGWCNGTNSSMTVNAQSLTNTTAAPSGFSNQVDFTATALAASQSAVDTNSTDNTAGAPVTVGIFSGDIKVTLSSSSSHGGSTLKMVAGAYAGDVLVTLTPAI
jgi:hypothetical protein